MPKECHCRSLVYYAARNLKNAEVSGNEVP